MASAALLRNLLEKVHLNGLINNCKISTFDDGLWLIEAIDERTSVLLSCQSKILKGNNWDLGLGDISILIKWLKLLKDAEIDIERKANRLTLISDDKGTLNYLLRDLEYITTQQEIDKNDKTPMDHILDTVEYTLEIPADARESLTKVMSIFKPGVVTLVFDKGEVSFSGGGETNHSFNIPVGSLNSEKRFSVSVDGKAFMSVLAVVEGLPEILFTNTAPIIIKENDDFMFSINTLAGE